MASGFWFNIGWKSCCNATVNPDGTVALVEGATYIGGSRAAIARQLAETLGIAAEDVLPTVVDTDSIGHTDVTGGSRVTFATGWAAYEAARDIQRQMIARAALIWDVEPAQVTEVCADAFDRDRCGADVHRGHCCSEYASSQASPSRAAFVAAARTGAESAS